MKIERENGEDVGPVWAMFTREEAGDLLDALTFYFEDEIEDAGWHVHIGGGDSELTVTIDIPAPP